MEVPPCPAAGNEFLAEHVKILLESYRRLTGRRLLAEEDDLQGEIGEAQRLFEAPFFVASHSTADDPILTYGNRAALELFEMSWEAFTTTPSRFTAEAPERSERERLLAAVSSQGYIDDYSGVRISSSGRRFQIEQATVWNLEDSHGNPRGQAATFSRWRYLKG
ncbi:MAG: MEKHLA domain-containing protein [Verrucomicrobiota bacterium]